MRQLSCDTHATVVRQPEISISLVSHQPDRQKLSCPHGPPSTRLRLLPSAGSLAAAERVDRLLLMLRTRWPHARIMRARDLLTAAMIGTDATRAKPGREVKRY